MNIDTSKAILVLLVPHKDQLLMILRQVVSHKEYFDVPAGFYTDLASVPKILQSIIRPYGLVSRAAILHDYGYIKNPKGMSRKEVDDMFFNVMIEDGVSKVKAYAMYFAVRFFSGGWWKKFRKGDN